MTVVVFHFEVSVHAFLIASVRAFPWCTQRLGCHSDQNARWLKHDACCFKLFGKPHYANSLMLLIIVSWRWVFVRSCNLCSKFWSFGVCIQLSKTFWFCFICRGWVCVDNRHCFVRPALLTDITQTATGKACNECKTLGHSGLVCVLTHKCNFANNHFLDSVRKN